MKSDILKGRNFYSELGFKSSRSSGPGGQNVNKLSTKVELRFNINSSNQLSDDEKKILAFKLKRKINSVNELIVVSQTERSQLKNKEKAIAKFYTLIEKALTPRKKRKPTRPTLASKARRVEKKQIRSRQKSLRKEIDYEK
jgi:ribosome-associated protein